MKRIVSILFAILLLLSTMAWAAEEKDLTAAPSAIIELLYQGEYQQVFDQSTADIQTALGTADGWETAWIQIAQVYGAYQGIINATAQEQSGLIIAEITCAHEHADITFSVVLYPGDLLGGLTVSAIAPKAPESKADTSLFVSEPIKLRSDEKDETHGMLILPAGDGPFPAVIMMQGSGPSDMNETAFGIAPFRDLAEGLASAGIASIRYDKYSYAHADLLQADTELLAGFTIQKEYILDARSALSLLQSDNRIGNVYLLGHSLGGMITPRVIQTIGAENFVGGIILAGSPLPLWELQHHQNLALLPEIVESERESAKVMLDNEVAKLSQMQTMTDEELQNMLFFGISAYYQMDQMSVDAAQTAIELQKPLFIAQGGKDWQVTPADGIEAWQTTLDNQLETAYRLYPNMNHMLCDMEGEPADDFTDYQAGRMVSQTLIDDIAAWILGNEQI